MLSLYNGCYPGPLFVFLPGKSELSCYTGLIPEGSFDLPSVIIMFCCFYKLCEHIGNVFAVELNGFLVKFNVLLQFLNRFGLLYLMQVHLSGV
jgi:hypothetical protein